MANRRPDFQIPIVINPPERRCIQISVPDDEQHLQIFAGLIRQLSDWQRWQRDPLKRGTLVAQVWREVWENIDWNGEDCMGCCPEPTNRRYNSEGQLEVSYDGGITWSLAPDADSRMSGIISPPLAGEDGDEKRCIGAASGMEYVKQNLIDDLSAGANYADINAAIIAIIVVLGVTGIGVLIAAAAAAIFIAGVSAVQAAFTAGVWDDFQCILYCNSEDDASFTVAGWERVKADILSTFTGVVSAVLYNWVNSVGTVGLTNSLRSGFATASDCSACECEIDWCYEWENLEQSPEWFMATSQPFGNYGYLYTDGWGTSQIGGVMGTRPDGYSAMIIQSNLTSSNIQQVEVWTTGGAPTLRRVGFPNTYSGFVNMSFVVDHWIVTGSWTVTQLRIFFECGSLNNPCKLTKIRLSGLGANPFGEDNCV